MINLETKISTFFGVPEQRGLKYGIELEYEGASISKLDQEKTPLTRWKIVPDESLRNNGIEFVSRPTALPKITEAIDQMLAAAKSINAKPTPRCGMHVHVNMTDKTFRELINLSVLYTLVEPLLFATYAQGRQENHFCVPTYCNTVLVENLYDDVQKLRRGIHLPKPKPKKRPTAKKQMFMELEAGEAPMPPQFGGGGGFGGGINVQKGSPASLLPNALRFYKVPKYAALNYRSLTTFGTVEYRQHPATISKFDLLEWIHQIHRIHEVAGLFTDPLEIIQLYDEDGLFTLCEKIGLLTNQEVDPYDLEDAVDAATMIAGHEPVSYDELNWEIA